MHSHSDKTTAARRLAQLVRDVRYSGLSNRVINEAKMRVFDTLGVTIAGAETESAVIMADLVTKFGGTAESLVLGRKTKTPAALAALANGTSAHSLDYDDWHATGSVHPGAVIVPVAIALAEKQKANGREVIEAVVAGYEAMIRLGMTTLATALEKGFHTTSICGPFGAAATAAKLLDLTENELVNAFGLAGSQASGIVEFIYSDGWVKRMHAGWSAHAGVISALLAKEGFTGPETVVDGKAGFCKVFSRETDLTPIMGAARDRYEITNVQTKIYASCSEAASAADAVLKLVRENRLSPHEIERIRLRVVKVAAEELTTPKERKYHPTTVVDAQFSLPFTVGAVVIRGKAGLSEFTARCIRNESILGIASKVEVSLDPKLDKLFPARSPALAEIVTVKGRTYSTRVDYARGTPRNPIGKDEIRAKFHECALTMFSEGRVKEIERNLDAIEQIRDINILTKQLAVDSGLKSAI